MLQLQPRALVRDGCLNVRDLGGLPTRDGGWFEAADTDEMLELVRARLRG